ncbi:MAG: hypothetical protein AAGB06_05610 [Verrucomicrobiota bacterium]
MRSEHTSGISFLDKLIGGLVKQLAIPLVASGKPASAVKMRVSALHQHEGRATLKR